MKNICIAIAVFLPFTCSAQPATAPIEVAVFISSECPISQKYIAVLNKIYREYGDKAAFHWRFIVTDDISKKDLRTFVDEFDIEFPVQKEDHKGTMTRTFMATVTPQVVIKDKDILYSGAIDNWFYGLGQYRQVITEHYLTDALDQLLKGQSPTTKETEPIGCPIARLTR